MKNPLVSVVIVYCNGKIYLEECLTSLRDQTYPEIEIIGVDNASSDGSTQFIKNRFSEVRIIGNKKNYGFAKGNNIGIKASRGKYIATLNNDTIVDPDWIKNLVSIAEEREDAAMFASKILFYGAHDLIESTGMVIYSDGIARCRGYSEKDGGNYDRVEDVLLPSACAALYRKDVLLRAGLFDEDYFAYCEDVDLGLRIRMLGWCCLYVPYARVYHHYSGTGRDNLLFKAYLIERNRLWMVFKIFPLPNLILAQGYTLVRYLFYLYGLLLNIRPVRKFYKNGSVRRVLFILLKIHTVTLINLIKIIRKRLCISRDKKMKSREIVNSLRRFRIGARELTLYKKDSLSLDSAAEEEDDNKKRADCKI
ncbi:MAG: glycosyltransferase family 2 protein [Candidatus Omnitrophica bacterium]|nr:glycosyltransferase family 2 protein [Candidatus Omnitrophota bacterium]